MSKLSKCYRRFIFPLTIDDLLQLRTRGLLVQQSGSSARINIIILFYSLFHCVDFLVRLTASQLSNKQPPQVRFTVVI